MNWSTYINECKFFCTAVIKIGGENVPNHYENNVTIKEMLLAPFPF